MIPNIESNTDGDVQPIEISVDATSFDKDDKENTGSNARNETMVTFGLEHLGDYYEPITVKSMVPTKTPGVYIMTLDQTQESIDLLIKFFDENPVNIDNNALAKLPDGSYIPLIVNPTEGLGALNTGEVVVNIPTLPQGAKVLEIKLLNRNQGGDEGSEEIE